MTEKVAKPGRMATIGRLVSAIGALNDVVEGGRAGGRVEADGSAGSTTSIEAVSDDNVIVTSQRRVGSTDTVRAAAAEAAAPAVPQLRALADAAAEVAAEHAAMREQLEQLQRRWQEQAPEQQRAKLEVRLAPFNGAWDGTNVDAWLREFQYELDIHRWAEPARALRSFLTGMAREFVINLGADVKNDFGALAACLRQRFAPADYDATLYKQIDSVQPAIGEPPSQVFGRMQILNARLSTAWRMTDEALFYRMFLKLVAEKHRAWIELAGDIRARMVVADRLHVHQSVWHNVASMGSDGAGAASVLMASPASGGAVDVGSGLVFAVEPGVGARCAVGGTARRGGGGKRMATAICFRCNAPGHKRFQCARVHARLVPPAMPMVNVWTNSPVGSVLAGEGAMRGALASSQVVEAFNHLVDLQGDLRGAVDGDMQLHRAMGDVANAIGDELQAVHGACVGVGDGARDAPLAVARAFESGTSNGVGSNSAYDANDVRGQSGAADWNVFNAAWHNAPPCPIGGCLAP